MILRARTWFGSSSTTCPTGTPNGTGELIVLLTTITDPTAARADERAAAYHERLEEIRQ
ncbi:MAG: hypothetical protein ACRDQ4_11155 [Pseudonocardiaceae bacterium]